MATILSSRFADHPQHVVEIIVKLWQAARIKDKATSSKQATRSKEQASKQARIKQQAARIKDKATSNPKCSRNLLGDLV